MENKTKGFFFKFKNFIGKINTSKTYRTQIIKKEKKIQV